MAKFIDANNTLNMRELAQSGDPKFMETLRIYRRALSKAFPDPAEIESTRVYKDYLQDATFPWTMLALRDSEGNLLGGIQYQVVTVGGVWLKKAIWAEHIWLVKSAEARNFKNLMTLLNIANEQFQASGAQLVFFEFNDRAKMSDDEMATDRLSGVSTQKRETMWARFGSHVLVDQRGFLAPYDQPGMGGEAPVEYLSLGFFPAGGKSLADNKLLVEDYEKLIVAAHITIPGITTEDVTVRKNVSLLRSAVDTGKKYFRYVPLAKTCMVRIANDRLKTR
jgi:hypothetical protein